MNSLDNSVQIQIESRGFDIEAPSQTDLTPQKFSLRDVKGEGGRREGPHSRKRKSPTENSNLTLLLIDPNLTSKTLKTG